MLRANLGMVAGIETVDPLAVRFDLLLPHADMPALAAGYLWRLALVGAVLAIIGEFCSRCLTMAVRWCSRFLPACLRSRWRARS